MAILDESTMDDFTGWTKVETEGTVTIDTSGGRSFHEQFKASGTSWNTNGVYRTTPTSGADGHTIYCDFQTNASSSQNMIGIRDTAAITYSGSASFYVQSIASNIDLWNGSTSVNSAFTSSADTWINIRFVVNSDGTITCHAHEDDGTQVDLIDAGDWTLIGSSTVANTFDATASDLYFMTNMSKPDPVTVWVDNFYYTDDGSLGLGGGGSSGSVSRISRARRQMIRRK